jgi:hypothetical protein
MTIVSANTAVRSIGRIRAQSRMIRREMAGPFGPMASAARFGLGSVVQSGLARGRAIEKRAHRNRRKTSSTVASGSVFIIVGNSRIVGIGIIDRAPRLGDDPLSAYRRCAASSQWHRAGARTQSLRAKVRLLL